MLVIDLAFFMKSKCLLCNTQLQQGTLTVILEIITVPDFGCSIDISYDGTTRYIAAYYEEGDEATLKYTGCSTIEFHSIDLDQLEFDHNGPSSIVIDRTIANTIICYNVPSNTTFFFTAAGWLP